MNGGENLSVFNKSREKVLHVRPMEPNDIEEVKEVGQISWSDLAMRDIGKKFRYPKRSEKIIEAYMWKEPKGCLVAVIDDKIVGSAFSHVWGKIGWIGPLEVLPTNQDAGVGKSLLKECENYLISKGCTSIGLETMSHLPKQMHFYLSSGFAPGPMVLILEKMLKNEDIMPRLEVDIVDQRSLSTVMPEISRISSRINPGLDYSVELQSLVEKKLGEAYIVRNNDTVLGAALLHTYQRGDESNYSSIKALFVDPKVDDQLDIFSSLLRECEIRSASMGKNRILSRMSSDHLNLYKEMLDRCYSLKGANLRMVKLNDYRESGSYHLVSWAG